MCRATRALWILVGIALVARMASSPSLAQDQTPAGAEPQWPLRLPSGAGELALYEPEWEEYSGEFLAGRAAASVLRSDNVQPVFGAVRLECQAYADRAARTVRVADIRVARARFPGFEEPLERVLTEALRRGLETSPWVLSLDGLMKRLEAVEAEKETEGTLGHAPPRIVFRHHPAVKVQYDGEPRLVRVEGSPLLRAVNTPFFVALDPDARAYYLRGMGRWFAAPDPLGPFGDAREVPARVVDHARESGALEDLAGGPRAEAVEIVTATEPTELIWTDGPPEFSPIRGTDLLHVSNTESDVFLLIPTQEYFVLLSGRWYRAAGTEGPWAHVWPDMLPADFAKIPPAHARGSVLAHVSGSRAAEDALLDNRVPETAVVDRETAERPAVTYDGDPRFVPVSGSPVLYAENSAFSVLWAGNVYYCCYDAVWFDGPTPFGPWRVCASVPAAICGLPPWCPLYPVRYVRVYDVTPSYVVFGYLPGYLGYYSYRGTVLYGTGYRYPAWCGARYYPRPCTFGYAARYLPRRRCWGFSVGWGDSSCWLHVRIGLGGWAMGGSYGYHCGGGWWGYGGYRHVEIHNDITVNVHVGAPAPLPVDSIYDRRGVLAAAPAPAPQPGYAARRRTPAPASASDAGALLPFHWGDLVTGAKASGPPSWSSANRDPGPKETPPGLERREERGPEKTPPGWERREERRPEPVVERKPDPSRGPAATPPGWERKEEERVTLPPSWRFLGRDSRESKRVETPPPARVETLPPGWERRQEPRYPSSSWLYSGSDVQQFRRPSATPPGWERREERGSSMPSWILPGSQRPAAGTPPGWERRDERGGAPAPRTSPGRPSAPPPAVVERPSRPASPPAPQRPAVVERPPASRGVGPSGDRGRSSSAPSRGSSSEKGNSRKK